MPPKVNPSPDFVRNFKRIVLTGAVATITITGALSGATLKMDQEVKENIARRQVLSVDDGIAELETRRRALTGQKKTIEDQIRQIDVRAEKKRNGAL